VPAAAGHRHAGHEVLRGIDRQNQEASLNMVRVERRIQQLESGIPFDPGAAACSWPCATTS
jgi:hypothetical protein